MKRTNMLQLEEHEILTKDVRMFIDKMTEDYMDVDSHCGLRIRERTIDTVAIWKLIKGEDKTYHIIYFLLGYNVANSALTEKAIINSPKILEVHEVLQPDGTDIVKFYLDNICLKH